MKPTPRGMGAPVFFLPPPSLLENCGPAAAAPCGVPRPSLCANPGPGVKMSPSLDRSSGLHRRERSKACKEEGALLSVQEMGKNGGERCSFARDGGDGSLRLSSFLLFISWGGGAADKRALKAGRARAAAFSSRNQSNQRSSGAGERARKGGPKRGADGGACAGQTARGVCAHVCVPSLRCATPLRRQDKNWEGGEALVGTRARN